MIDTFIFDTDASQFAIGAVLSQEQSGVERPEAYASRKLSKAKTNYCVTRKELLAVVNFLKYFRHYLLGRTNHAALQWLLRISESIGQQACWMWYMEEFDFEIHHRAGSRHGNADSMSRRPCRLKDCLCQTSGHFGEVTEANVGDDVPASGDVHSLSTTIATVNAFHDVYSLNPCDMVCTHRIESAVVAPDPLTPPDVVWNDGRYQ